MTPHPFCVANRSRFQFFNNGCSKKCPFFSLHALPRNLKNEIEKTKIGPKMGLKMTPHPFCVGNRSQFHFCNNGCSKKCEIFSLHALPRNLKNEMEKTKIGPKMGSKMTPHRFWLSNRCRFHFSNNACSKKFNFFTSYSLPRK